MGMTPRPIGVGEHCTCPPCCPALSAAIGHPTPTKVHADPKACQRALGLPDAESAIVVLVDGLATGTSPCASATRPICVR